MTHLIKPAIAIEYRLCFDIGPISSCLLTPRLSQQNTRICYTASTISTVEGISGHFGLLFIRIVTWLVRNTFPQYEIENPSLTSYPISHYILPRSPEIIHIYFNIFESNVSHYMMDNQISDSGYSIM